MAGQAWPVLGSSGSAPNQCMLPGLQDAHGHVLELGWSISSVNLVGASSVQEIIERVENYVEARPDVLADEDLWIEGLGWDQTRWSPPIFPAASDLASSRLLANRRISLRRVDVHALWLSPRALADVERGARFPRPDQDVPGGLVVRAPDGSPTGILIDRAMEFAYAVIPSWTDEDRSRYLSAAQRSLLEVGITSVGDAAADLDTLDFLRKRDAQGSLAVRIYGMLACPANSARCSDEAARRGFPLLPSPSASNRLTVRTVKLFADGALGSWGSAMWDPYADRPASNGLLLIPEADVQPLIQHWVDAAWQVATHAIGDRANSIVLDAYEAVLTSSAHEGKDLRPRVEHAQLLRLNDTARFGSLGVIASMQPTHCTSDMGYVEHRIGLERSRGAYAWQSVLSAGGLLALGSDFPVELPNPMHGLYSAITRLDSQGHSPHGSKGWFPKERLTRAQALHGFTRAAAHAQFEEHISGAIHPNFRADLVVFDRDVMDEGRTSPSQLRAAQVLYTLVDGHVVYASTQR
ncbi:amidohydrolase 3 [Ceraceosorus guamensis]|uniref:Amidohydrolase 3 n=1 Tax=Ceraceosorus guamensis TaxID=1522189 RepID=A0A316W0N2_9BASI|nr:amidohydrolase 3 [Ceraceosorus guamensis]PWN43094.1 amidohydrolase 3 [Ceraceosorus guamensis]